MNSVLLDTNILLYSIDEESKYFHSVQKLLLKNLIAGLLMKIVKYLVIYFIIVTSLKAQEIGISATKIWTDNYEIENPLGFSIYYFQPIGILGIKIEFVSAKNSRNYYGLLNGGFLIRPEDFIQDNISSKSTYRAIEFSCQIPKLYEIYSNYISIGAGISFDKFTRNKLGISSGKEYSISENKFGLFYSISLSQVNIFETPLKLELLFKHKGLIEGNYATDIEQPFVSTMDVKEFQINFAYVF